MKIATLELLFQLIVILNIVKYFTTNISPDINFSGDLSVKLVSRSIERRFNITDYKIVCTKMCSKIWESVQ